MEKSHTTAIDMKFSGNLVSSVPLYYTQLSTFSSDTSMRSYGLCYSFNNVCLEWSYLTLMFGTIYYLFVKRKRKLSGLSLSYPSSKCEKRGGRALHNGLSLMLSSAASSSLPTSFVKKASHTYGGVHLSKDCQVHPPPKQYFVKYKILI